MATNHDAESEQDLFDRYFDGKLDPREGQLLAQLLAGDDAKARRFARSGTLHHQLRLLLKYQEVQPLAPDTSSRFSPWAWSWLFVPTLAACLAVTAAFYFRSDPLDVAGEQASANKSDPHNVADSDASRPVWVARLVRSTSDVTWAEGSGPTDFFLRLHPGQVIELLSGLAEFEFNSGAVVILHGPAVFTPISAGSATLTRGRVTGRAEEGNFYLTTPSARVIDLGTEFGVVVDDTSSTDVVVFQGEVSVELTESHARRVEAIFLDDGATARIAANGELATGVPVEWEAFKRAIPHEKRSAHELPIGDRLSLIDIIIGGDGRGNALAGILDPLTGSRVERPWKNKNGPGRDYSDGRYHRSQSDGLIDGVFIPPRRDRETQITSLDHRADLPANSGMTWGPIWARRRSEGALPSATGEMWGTRMLPFILRRIDAAQIGAVGMHPNVGMTLDLHKFREADRRRFQSFDATLVNLDLAQDLDSDGLLRTPVRTADFWVFVDGELKYSRRNFGRDVEGQPFKVELAATDRFLTLVATDGGNSISFDHVMLIDPILTLSDVAD